VEADLLAIVIGLVALNEVAFLAPIER